MIHKTAIIDSKAEISSNVEIGPYTVIGPSVVIDEGTYIQSHANITGNTCIGKGNKIYPFASIGNHPQDMKYKGEETKLTIGDNNTIREYATINPGNSGGPIMNQKGNIVGVAVQTWIEDGIQGIHFGIKSSTLKTFANSNKLSFEQPNYRELSNKDLGKLITEATVYVECHMTIAKIKKMIAQSDNKKAFFSEYR